MFSFNSVYFSVESKILMVILNSRLSTLMAKTLGVLMETLARSSI